MDGVPWRFQTDIYMWDGQAYSLYHSEFTPPEYRFQAVQDGDRATLWGDYKIALSFYQQAIFDGKLKSWSLEQWSYEQITGHPGIDAATRTPTPAPTPAPDPAEYSNLAAYARYRIMLLHIQQGHDSDAKVVYDTLQQKFPPGQAGHVYAELAGVFWNSYQEELNLKQACAVAIKYAASHTEEILGYIGMKGDYHGWQSHDYTPEDICPFP